MKLELNFKVILIMLKWSLTILSDQSEKWTDYIDSFHDEIGLYNQQIAQIDHFKLISDYSKNASGPFKVIVGNYEIISDQFKIISDQFNIISIYILDQPNKNNLAVKLSYWKICVGPTVRPSRVRIWWFLNWFKFKEVWIYVIWVK